MSRRWCHRQDRPQVLCLVTGVVNGPERGRTPPKRAPYRSGLAGTVRDLGAGCCCVQPDTRQLTDGITLSDREVRGERAPSRYGGLVIGHRGCPRRSRTGVLSSRWGVSRAGGTAAWGRGRRAASGAPGRRGIDWRLADRLLGAQRGGGGCSGSYRRWHCGQQVPGGQQGEETEEQGGHRNHGHRDEPHRAGEVGPRPMACGHA
jgi:hypothetical protein